MNGLILMQRLVKGVGGGGTVHEQKNTGSRIRDIKILFSQITKISK